jgi:hypothetical protein
MFNRVLTAALITAASLGFAASASASSPQIGPAPVPEVKWIEWPDTGYDPVHAHHNTTATALGAGYEIQPHNPRRP